MKALLLPALFLLASCQPDQIDSSQTYTQQEGHVKISIATRGSYQFILQPDGNDSAKNYLITNYADSLKSYFLNRNSNVRELPIISSGITSPAKGTVYYPAPDDGPVPAYELPTVQLTALRRR